MITLPRSCHSKVQNTHQYKREFLPYRTWIELGSEVGGGETNLSFILILLVGVLDQVLAPMETYNIRAHPFSTSVIHLFSPHGRRPACIDAACWARVKRLVGLILLKLSWCCGRGTSPPWQVPTQCGTPFSGLHGSGVECKGWYAGSHAGFKTTCCDSYSRGGGCGGVSFAFGRHDATPTRWGCLLHSGATMPTGTP